MFTKNRSFVSSLRQLNPVTLFAAVCALGAFILWVLALVK